MATRDIHTTWEIERCARCGGTGEEGPAGIPLAHTSCPDGERHEWNLIEVELRAEAEVDHGTPARWTGGGVDYGEPASHSMGSVTLRAGGWEADLDTVQGLTDKERARLEEVCWEAFEDWEPEDPPERDDEDVWGRGV